MMTLKQLTRWGAALLAAVLALPACTDTSGLEDDMDALQERIDALQTLIASSNSNAIAVGKFIKGDDLLVTGVTTAEYGYTLELSDGTSVTVTFGQDAPSIVPVIGVDSEGRWIISTDGGQTFSLIDGADNALSGTGATPQVSVDGDGYWTVSLDGGTTWSHILDSYGKPVSATDGASVAGTSSYFRNVTYGTDSSAITFTLLDGRTLTVPVLNTFYLKVTGYTDGQAIGPGEELRYAVEVSDVASCIIKAPDLWTAVLTDEYLSVTAPASGTDGEQSSIDVVIISPEGYIRNVRLTFTFSSAGSFGKTGCKQWDDFYEGNSDNVLLDWSYAGYDHGESVPADGLDLGYTVYNVCDYGAVPNDGISDRDAVIAAYQAAIGEGKVQNPDARAVLYFPEGEFILHTAADNSEGKSSSIMMRAGAFVVKGAGRDKTTLVMQDPNLPASDALYSSPVMLELKHYSGLSEITSVTGDAAKGSFSVEVASASGVSAGDWVCLYVVNNDAEFVAQELSPYSAESSMTNITGTGVQVWDYHQVKSVDGNVVTFVEPLMHAVEAKWGWTIQKYPHYEMVGVEDLTFKGNAKTDFVHHGSWQDDGGYKPLAMTRLTNAWLRRVRFTSVSEACTLTNCANVSVYDIEIDGARGHSSIRAQQCSRAFVGKVYDHSDGNLVSSGTYKEGVGQYHAVGVSKPSIGTVLWRDTWGSDACFESHATQPRATLVDACKGGWIQYRQGGDASQTPNHLSDLVIWNFESTTAWSGTWDWWKTNSVFWKFLPPIVVGFHGESCTFLESQTLVDSYHGQSVSPESLYEAQLRARLGYVPAWLNSLK